MIVRHRLAGLIFFIVFLFTGSTLANTSNKVPNTNQAAYSLKVVATIPPLHSLLSSLMHGVGEPRLLLDRNQSAHHFSLRPSQRNLLNDADIIFWIGAELEAYMPRTLKALPAKVKSVSLISTPGIKKLEVQDSQHHNHGHHGSIDPHIWLSIDNTIKLSEAMANTLSLLDPAQQNVYSANLETLIASLQKLKHTAEKTLAGKTFSYLVYHDAYRYFETDNGLSPVAVISNDEERAPGIKRLSNINRILQQKKISCIIYNTSSMPKIMHNLAIKKHTNAVFIQPLGRSLNPGKALYSELMTQLIKGYQQCNNK